ncbi:MAG: DUF4041 domain-containing protein [Rhodospirillales bacterium]|nr:DUF4041 domain-containing protein [Rhodospirillales bacterium]
MGAEIIWTGVALLLLASPIVAIVLTLRLRRRRKEINELRNRFSAILDVEEEAAKAKKALGEQTRQIEELRSSYADKRKTYDRLTRELAIYDERLAFAELGVYEPHFEFTDSEAFKEAIKKVRKQQKAMVKDKTAVFCNTRWEVEGSTSKGQTMTNRGIRLTLRAFNNECDVAIANARWNNVNAMIKRIENARAQIDKMNASINIHISPSFERLKLKELRLTHEYREKRKQERDERTEAARLAREEKRLLQEAEEAKQEEEKYKTLLAQVRAEVGVVDTQEQEERIRQLEEQLAAAHEKTERAQAMAEKTKSGFVYVISNIGSFGEDVVKIGLTRRLDPLDRVKELGDASVPFLFDTHAMIYSEEAPALEAALHSEFDDRRINAANMRKEFFRVSIEEVEDAVQRLAPDAEFFKDVEAQEYRETLARREELAQQEEERRNSLLPQSI